MVSGTSHCFLLGTTFFTHDGCCYNGLGYVIHETKHSSSAHALRTFERAVKLALLHQSKC